MLPDPHVIPLYSPSSLSSDDVHLNRFTFRKVKISNGFESLVSKAHNAQGVLKLKAKFLKKVKTNVLLGMPRQN